MFALSCGLGFCRTWRWTLAGEKTPQEHASAAATTLRGRKTKAGAQAVLGMLSGALGRSGEDKGTGLFEQLRCISSSSPAAQQPPPRQGKHTNPRKSRPTTVRTEPAHKPERKGRDVSRWDVPLTRRRVPSQELRRRFVAAAEEKSQRRNHRGKGAGAALPRAEPAELIPAQVPGVQQDGLCCCCHPRLTAPALAGQPHQPPAAAGSCGSSLVLSQQSSRSSHLWSWKAQKLLRITKIEERAWGLLSRVDPSSGLRNTPHTRIHPLPPARPQPLGAAFCLAAAQSARLVPAYGQWLRGTQPLSAQLMA